MATPSKSQRTARPSVGPTFQAKGGSTMLWKLAVAIAVAIGSSFIPAIGGHWPWVLAAGVVVAFIVEGVRVVPQQFAYVIERFGRYHVILEPGLRLIWPFMDRVAYVHSLKEVPLDVPEQTC